MEQEKLNEIVANHVKWLQGDGGKWANLAAADLYGADLEGVNLRRANLRGANLRRASLRRACLYGADLERTDLEGANLEGANLEGANLEGASLYRADLRGASLCRADLDGANLPTGMYQVVGAGICNRCTTYDVINDQIVCGCWTDLKGNHLDSFIKRIEKAYGPYGEGHNPIYYAEYMAVVNFFKAMKELKENHDRKKGAIL